MFANNNAEIGVYLSAGEGSNISEDVQRSQSQGLLVVGEGSSDVGQASQVDPAKGEGAELLTGACPFAQLPQELP